MGPKVDELEKSFSKLIGTKQSVALSSCTAALHLANLIVGLKEGDEVILPSLTFVATANSLRYVGAKPVFADIQSVDDWTISIEDIERKKAINVAS